MTSLAELKSRLNRAQVTLGTKKELLQQMRPAAEEARTKLKGLGVTDISEIPAKQKTMQDRLDIVLAEANKEITNIETRINSV